MGIRAKKIEENSYWMCPLCGRYEEEAFICYCDGKEEVEDEPSL